MRLIKQAALLALLVVAVVPAVAQAAPRDRDGDGMADRWEKRFGVASAEADPDRDRVDNRNEFVEGTKPRDRDSDDDRRRDGREDRDRDRLSNAAEDATGNDPTDRDTDGDGIPDGKEQAGVVSAYDEATGSLTIELANGGSVTALVGEATDVDCATEAEAEEPVEEEPATAAQRGRPGPPGGPAPRPREGLGPAEGDGAGGFGCDGRREGDDEVECPEGTLAVGAKVHEATLKVTPEGAVWKEIEILVPAA